MLHVVATATSSTTVTAGKTMTASIHVYATKADSAATTLKLTTSKSTTIAPRCSTGCNLGTVDESGKFVAVTVTVPKAAAAGSMTFSAAATATGATSAKDVLTINVKRPTASTTTTDSGNTSGSGGSGGAGSSSGTSGTSGNTGTTLGTTVPGSGAAYVPPSAAGALSPATAGAPPAAQFPQIAPQQQPGGNTTLAGVGAAQNMGALRAASPEPQELTFQRLASTQAAWLAALLVAFSLLLTQVRLNRPADARRRKGMHRRRRSGAFQA